MPAPEPALAETKRPDPEIAGPLALRLGRWAATHTPSRFDEDVARGALLDTVCVALAAREHPIARMAATLGAPGQWSAMAHALDYDDLHLPSTSHISAVCVPVALAYGGGGRAYLAGAGVMARIGTLLGWRHYDAGWHATATAGVFGAAATAAVALELGVEGIASALALAVCAAGGVQRAFGSDAKPLQVGMAAQAGAQAAELASQGARPDLGALDDWLPLVQATNGELEEAVRSIPGGLAVKIFPCCYALQRPIFAMREILGAHDLTAAAIGAIEVRSPLSSVKPLLHHRPRTGAQGKFSLEYGVAAAVLDGFPDQWSFTDAAVSRPPAQELLRRVRFVAGETGGGLLDGACEILVRLADGRALTASLALPEGSPDRPPSDRVLDQKAVACLDGLQVGIAEIEWGSAAAILAAHSPASQRR
jgi:2-methylcitrate dehydratase PrpD